MPRFPTTVWTTIRRAGDGAPTAEASVVETYRPVIVRFAQLRGFDAQAAEDVAQEVLLRLFDERLLGRADKERGRFRALLVALTRHVIGHHLRHAQAQKRGGGTRPLSLDAPLGDGELHDIVGKAEPEPDFDREWVAALLARALGKLEKENPAQSACLRAFLVEELSHREVAERTGKSDAAVRNAISRGRARLAEILRAEVAAYSSSAEEYEGELAFIEKFLGETPA